MSRCLIGIWIREYSGFSGTSVLQDSKSVDRKKRKYTVLNYIGMIEEPLNYKEAACSAKK